MSRLRGLMNILELVVAASAAKITEEEFNKLRERIKQRHIELAKIISEKSQDKK